MKIPVFLNDDSGFNKIKTFCSPKDTIKKRDKQRQEENVQKLCLTQKNTYIYVNKHTNTYTQIPYTSIIDNKI